MSYQLRRQGFSNLTCHLTDADIDYIRTLLLITNSNQEIELKVETFISEYSVNSYIDLGNNTYLEGTCHFYSDASLEMCESKILSIPWKFKITYRIPF